MLYKTICLQMIQERPEMYDQLLNTRNLLPTLEHYARELRTRHLAWKEELSQANPGSSEEQIASEAREFALREMEQILSLESPPDDHETQVFLDQAMAFISCPMPPELGRPASRFSTSIPLPPPPRT